MDTFIMMKVGTSHEGQMNALLTYSVALQPWRAQAAVNTVS
jgi:hypothetical protein